MKSIIIGIACILFSVNNANSQSIKNTYVVDGKTYIAYHSYHIFPQTFLPIEYKIGYWRFDSIGKEPITYSWTHLLALDTKSFVGNEFAGYNIPFVGQCGERIKAIIINGKRHVVTNPEDIYFRQLLKLENGYNRVYVNVELDNKIVLKGKYIEIEIKKM